jgi:dUTP pyrophosphatase
MNIKTIITDPRLGTEFPLPTFATKGSAAIDLRAMISDPVHLHAGQQITVDSGMRIWIEDPRYAAMIIPRSGAGSKGLVVGNLVGLIDSDYQGPLKICLWNRPSSSVTVINPGDRVAQLLVVPVQQFQIDLVDDFNSITSRGSGGFGHTGAQ